MTAAARFDIGRPWPVWKDRLPPATAARPEGGLRLRGSAPRPLVSYVTVVKNAAATLERTLASVRQQSCREVEHIVLDGGSTDGTLEIIQKNADTLAYFASEPDAGLYDALNKAIELAAGELICVLNADDWLTGDAAAIALRRHREGSARADKLVLSAAWAMDGERQTLWLPARVGPASVLSCANVCHNAVYATRAAYEASGPYRADLRIAADFAWLVDCQRAGVAFDRDELPTLHYSMGGMSSDTRRHTTECMQILRKNFPVLSEAEAWGLVHCFHIFAPNLAPFAESRPAHHGRFLRELAQRHADDTGLMQALAHGCVEIMRHPADAQAADKLTRLEKLKRSVHKRVMKLRAVSAARPGPR